MSDVLKRSSEEPQVQKAIIPSQQTKESIPWKETIIQAHSQLEQLKKEIEAGKMSFDTVKKYIESLKDVKTENKPFILWGILSGLNQMWISIENVQEWKITLKEWHQNLMWKLNIASYQETRDFEKLLNNGVWRYFTQEDLQKSLLYRTHNSLEKYIGSKFENQETSTSEYALILLEKYKIKVEIDPSLSPEEKTKLEKQKGTKAYFERINFENEASYKNFIATIKTAITDNQAEKEFLVWFFDDLFYHKWKNINDNSPKSYQKTSKKNQAEIFTEINALSQDQKYALGIKSENQAKEAARKWTNNPLEAIKDSIWNGWLSLWLILWIIWAIFWWKRWFFGWILAGIWIGAWGLSVAWELIKGKWWTFGKSESSKDNSPTPTSSPEKTSQWVHYSKINFAHENDAAKKLELQNLWWKLSKNDLFLSAPSSILNIFSEKPEKTFEELQTLLKTYNIDLTQENKESYKTIFAEILKQRTAQWVWAPLPNETIGTYLERTSAKSVATAVSENPKAGKKPEVITSAYATTMYKIVDGKTYLIGENGEYLIWENSLTPEAKEVMKKYEQIGILNEILQIWIPHAEKEASSLLFKWMRSGTTVIPESVKNIKKTFEQLFLKAQKWEKIDADINTIWQEIEKAESATSIIGASDMKKVKDTFYSSYDNKDQKLLKIYDAMRYGGWSGNSEWVKNQITEHLLRQDAFKNTDDILKNPHTYDLIKNHNTSELEKRFGKEIANEILWAYSKIKIKQEKHKKEYSDVLVKINQDRKAQWQTEISFNDYMELNLELTIAELLKHSLLKKQIKELSHRWNETSSYTGMYANIVWLAESKGNDWMKISDENIDKAIDIGSTLAIAAVSMWVGAIAARWALAAARWWANATRLTALSQKAGKAWSVARFAWASTVEWIAFYEWYNTMNNIVYGNNILENAGNVKEISKTIAFMWVLRWISWVMKNAELAHAIKLDSQGLSLWATGNTLAFVGKMTDKVPAWVLKNTWEILIKWWLISGTSVGLDYVFDGEADWTWEEYLQAVMMVWAMKLAGKVNFSKKNGTVEVKTQNSPQTNSFLKWVWEKVGNKLWGLPKQIKDNLTKTIIDLLKSGMVWWTAFAVGWGWINVLNGNDFTDNIIENFLKWFAAWAAVKLVFMVGSWIKHVFTIGKDWLLKQTWNASSKLPSDWKKIALLSSLAYWGYEIYSFSSKE